MCGMSSFFIIKYLLLSECRFYPENDAMLLRHAFFPASHLHVFVKKIALRFTLNIKFLKTSQIDYNLEYGMSEYFCVS